MNKKNLIKIIIPLSILFGLFLLGNFTYASFLGPYPTIYWAKVKNATDHSIEIEIKINPNDCFTQVWLEYGKFYPLEFKTEKKNIGPDNDYYSLHFTASNLEANSRYILKVIAENSEGNEDSRTLTAYTQNTSYSPPPSTPVPTPTPTPTIPSSSRERPKIITLPAKYISKNSALLSGKINPNGSQTTFWFEWGTSPALGHSTIHQSADNGHNYKEVSFLLTNLNPETTYYFRLVGQNANGITLGGINRFRTYTYIKKTAKVSPKTTATPSKKEKESREHQTASLSEGLAETLKALFSNWAFWLIFTILFLMIVYLIFKK